MPEFSRSLLAQAAALTVVDTARSAGLLERPLAVDPVLAEAEKLPLRYAYNFLPNTYFMLCAYASNPQERGQYATRYLNTILGYSNIPEMRKRPYAVNKRQLLSAYSNLAISAEAIG